MADLQDVKLSVKLPFVGVEGTWAPDKSEQEAAWEMYVELITRISVAPLAPEEGLLREALTSLYTIFGTTRAILRKYGPSVAQPKSDGDLSLGQIAVAILNRGLRPVLAKWHPTLLHYESTRQASVSPLEHERRWESNAEMRQVLDQVRETMTEYANVLAQVAGVPPLVEAENS